MPGTECGLFTHKSVLVIFESPGTDFELEDTKITFKKHAKK
jgi:hypothetical protein